MLDLLISDAGLVTWKGHRSGTTGIFFCQDLVTEVLAWNEAEQEFALYLDQMKQESWSKSTLRDVWLLLMKSAVCISSQTVEVLVLRRLLIGK